MLHLDFNAIQVSSNRIRKEFSEEKLQDLAESISAKGLLHPPVVRQEDDSYILVAGERRLRAMETILFAGQQIRVVKSDVDDADLVPPGKVPVLLLQDMPPDDIREVELEENIMRQDITWQERVRAIAEIHEMRVKQGITQKQPWSSGDTGQEVYDDLEPNTARRRVNDELLLAKNLDDDLIAKAENPKVAMKLLKRQREEKLSASFADFLQETISGDEQFRLLQGDCIQGLREWQDDDGNPGFDLFLMDPPYGVDAQKFNQGDRSSTESLFRHTYDDSVEAFETLMPQTVEAVTQASADQSAVYHFCDIKRWRYLVDLYEARGWKVWPWPLVYYKRGKGLAPSAEYGPQRRYEMILYANRGQKKLRMVRSDVLGLKDRDIDEEADKAKIHAAAKPIWLLRDLIERTCYAGERICDPFMGSGSTALAAKRLGVFFVGWEIDSSTHKMALARFHADREELT